MVPLYLSPFDWAQVYDLVEGNFMIRTAIFEMASNIVMAKTHLGIPVRVYPRKGLKNEKIGASNQSVKLILTPIARIFIKISPTN